MPTRSNKVVPALRSLCEQVLLSVLEKNNYHPKLINDLCKRVPHSLLENIFKIILDRNAITDVALLAFLMPDRTQLDMKRSTQIRNATFKQISYHCPNLRFLDLSDCVQVSNSVVTEILQGCSNLSDLRLNRCHRITDAAFDSTESLFHPLIGCLSLEAISLQGCPQLTGSVVATLNKLCMQLKFLNLSQCKRVSSRAIQHILEHNHIISLNISFIDGVCDEAFHMPTDQFAVCSYSHRNSYYDMDSLSRLDAVMAITPITYTTSSHCCGVSQFKSYHQVAMSPLKKLFLGKSSITDVSMYRLSYLSQLVEISLQWCTGITDAGVTVLSRVCPKLEDVDLKSCQITDQSLEALAMNCVFLRHLDLSWCTEITDDGFHKLAILLASVVQSRVRPESSILDQWRPRPTSPNTVAVDALGRRSFQVQASRRDVSSSVGALPGLRRETCNQIIHDQREVDSSYAVMPTNGTESNIGLQSLDIVWCTQLTDSTLNALMLIPSLVELDISGCPSMSDSQVSSVRKHGVFVKATT